MRTKRTKASPAKVIHIVDAKLIGDLKASANRRGFGDLSVSQIVRRALAEWTKAG